ncbi:hypothetical protein VTN31DRAFT_2332 [Thermomyces dupontii]|uniref:uncharacterized protein n=1 Tax=Talaromyces thermophilus TaxID=28565 RepID=UPI003742A093
MVANLQTASHSVCTSLRSDAFRVGSRQRKIMFHFESISFCAAPWFSDNPGAELCCRPLDLSRWCVIYCDHLGLWHYFLVPYIYELFSKRKPHQILLMASDHLPVENDALIRSEILAMVSFTRWTMRVLEHQQSPVYPVSPPALSRIDRLT